MCEKESLSSTILQELPITIVGNHCFIDIYYSSRKDTPSNSTMTTLNELN